MAGKCCKVIIDSGSSTNLASEELVTKLQLSCFMDQRWAYDIGKWAMPCEVQN